MLAGAKVDPDAAGIVSDARRDATARRQAGSTRKGKRKANGVAAEEDSATDDEADDLGDGAETPQPSDGAATDDDTDGEGFEPAAAPSETTRRSTRSNNGKAAAVPTRATGGDAIKMEHSSDPPPPRVLPFKASRNDTGLTKASEPASTAVDEDDDETDEEL